MLPSHTGWLRAQHRELDLDVEQKQDGAVLSPKERESELGIFCEVRDEGDAPVPTGARNG